MVLGGFARVVGLFPEFVKKRKETFCRSTMATPSTATPGLLESRGQAIVPILNGLGLPAMTDHWGFAQEDACAEVARLREHGCALS